VLDLRAGTADDGGSNPATIERQLGPAVLRGGAARGPETRVAPGGASNVPIGRPGLAPGRRVSVPFGLALTR
jgi:hypothetical protein